jgi:hypothetical protein
MTRPWEKYLPAWLHPEKLSLETALLIAAARVERDEEERDWAQALSLNQVDWDELLRQGAGQGMTPLLYRFLHDVCPDVVPQGILNSLRQSVWENTQRNLRLTGELVRILDLFAAEGISAIAFKGPTLAALAFGDLAWREFSDLDVLIDKRRLAKAGDLLRERGYRAQEDLAQADKSAFLEVSHELAFARPGDGYSIDLHWELAPKLLHFGMRGERLRQRLTPTWPGGKKVMTLAPEDLLLYLCAHAVMHCWGRLGWIADIARLIHQRPGFDWDLALAQAREQRSERTLFLGLLLAGDLLGASVPAAVERQMRADKTVETLAARVGAWLFLSGGSAPGLVARDLYYFKLQKGLRDKFGYLFRLLTAPNVNDWDFLPLPASLSFLYPLVRPIRFIKNYVWGL